VPGSRISTSRTVAGPIFSSHGVFAKQLDGHDGGLVEALGLDLRTVPDLAVVNVADEAGPERHDPARLADD